MKENQDYEMYIRIATATRDLPWGRDAYRMLYQMDLTPLGDVIMTSLADDDKVTIIDPNGIM